jgi:hypothetical protein
VCVGSACSECIIWRSVCPCFCLCLPSFSYLDQIMTICGDLRSSIKTATFNESSKELHSYLVENSSYYMQLVYVINVHVINIYYYSVYTILVQIHHEFACTVCFGLLRPSSGTQSLYNHLSFYLLYFPTLPRIYTGGALYRYLFV